MNKITIFVLILTAIVEDYVLYIIGNRIDFPLVIIKVSAAHFNPMFCDTPPRVLIHHILQRTNLYHQVFPQFSNRKIGR